MCVYTINAIKLYRTCCQEWCVGLQPKTRAALKAIFERECLINPVQKKSRQEMYLINTFISVLQSIIISLVQMKAQNSHKSQLDIKATYCEGISALVL